MQRRWRTVCVIPAFNEGETIENVVRQVRKYVQTVVVVDDGSSDDTFINAERGGAIVLLHICNLGQGAALETGFEYSRKLKADVVVTFDADGQFVAEEIPQIVESVKDGKADVIFGSRFLGKQTNISISRYLILKTGIYFTYLFSGIKLSDTHNGFRAFNKKALGLIHLTQNRMAHASEIIDQVKYHCLEYQEVPVTVIYSDYSKAKGQKMLGAIRIIVDLLISKIY